MSKQKTCKHLLCDCKTTPLGACGAESQQDTSERVPHIMKPKQSVERIAGYIFWANIIFPVKSVI